MEAPYHRVVRIDETRLERLGAISRHIFFSPSLTGNKHIKFAYVSMDPGTVSPPHRHIGDEAIYTLSGIGECRLEGKTYLLEKDTAFVIPPGKTHPVKVVSKEPWAAIGAYCDECPMLKEYIAMKGKLELK
ncbi:MAG: cupin domain-containing protein [Candidatus Geothermarchaeales archaeon]